MVSTFTERMSVDAKEAFNALKADMESKRFINWHGRDMTIDSPKTAGEQLAFMFGQLRLAPDDDEPDVLKGIDEIRSHLKL